MNEFVAKLLREYMQNAYKNRDSIAYRLSDKRADMAHCEEALATMQSNIASVEETLREAGQDLPLWPPRFGPPR